MKRWAWVVALVVAVAGAGTAAGAERTSENVIIVTIDGFRWQELFTGADLSFIEHPHGGVRDVAGTRERFWRESAEERRRVMMPFFWETIAKEGQVFGDAAAGCEARVANTKNVSYPGYSEIFCGFADPAIEDNSRVPNPNLNVLEFLNGRPGFEGNVVAFCTWDVFPFILNTERSRVPVVCGWKPLADEPLSEREREVNRLLPEVPRIWHDNAMDFVTTVGALEHLKKRRPRVMFIGLGETDEWAHSRRYDLYLEAAQKNDRFLRELWGGLQSTPEYAGKTTLIVTTDHGRGTVLTDWTDHKAKTVGAERTWVAVIGPDTPSLGVRRGVSVTQSQIAATLAAVVGEDFAKTSEKVAAPLPGVVGE